MDFVHRLKLWNYKFITIRKLDVASPRFLPKDGSRIQLPQSCRFYNFVIYTMDRVQKNGFKNYNAPSSETVKTSAIKSLLI